MASVVARLKKGKITLSVIKGTFEGKTSTSYTLKKQNYNKETNQWTDSDFLSVTDLQDVNTLTMRMLTQVVKVQKVEPKPEPEPEPEPVENQEIPF